MFAPPPIQLSRDEIQSRLSDEHRKREQGWSAATYDDRTPNSLLGISLRGIPQRNRHFNKEEKVTVSRAISTRTQSKFQLRNGLPRLENVAREGVRHVHMLPPGFAEHPRQAPTPPRRPTTRATDPQSPLSLSQSQESEIRCPLTPQSPSTAPPIPQKSSKRRSLTEDQQGPEPVIISPIRAKETRRSVREGPSSPQYVYWPSPHRPKNNEQVVSTNKKPRIPRIVQQMTNALSDEVDIGLHTTVTPTSNDRGAAQVDNDDIAWNNNLAEATSISMRPYSEEEVLFMKKTLPETPGQCSTELYHSLSSYQFSQSNGPPRLKKTTSLSKLTELHGEILSSPARLSAISEASSFVEHACSTADSSTSMATHWQLRGGSMITVTPPESAPWLRYVFVQRPIRLAAAVNGPRNQSVASLEPFQDAMDGFHLGTAWISRRRSDDQALDDVCNFFDGFGFDSISYAGDMFASADVTWEGMAESIDGADGEIERLSAPPAEPELLSSSIQNAQWITWQATQEALRLREHSFAVNFESAAKFHRMSETPHSRNDSATLTPG